MTNKSYILFSQTSTGTGQRNTWNGNPADGSAGGLEQGLIQGVPTMVASSAFNANANVEQVNGTTARHSLDFISTGTAAGSGFESNLSDGRAFTSAHGNANPVVTSGFSGGVLSVSLANRDWNGIKNLEMLVDAEDLAGLTGISIRNFVDVRIKLGDTVVQPNCSGNGYSGSYVVDIENVKRGELIGTHSDKGIDASLTLSTNLARANITDWQASFVMVGSQFGDSLTLAQGDMTGPAATLGTQVFDNTGLLQLVTANLGAGDDVFNGGNVQSQTAITLGADFGRLYFGSPGTVKLGFSDGEQGATAQLSDWFADAAAAGLDVTLGAYFRTTGGNIGTAAASSILTGAADVAAIPGTDFNAGFSQTSGMWFGPADLSTAQTTPELFPDAGGLGISQANRTEFFGGGANLTNQANAAANGMGEINSWGGADGNQLTDVLRVSWDGPAAMAVKVSLSFFYCGENGGEVARIQLWNNGVMVDDSLYGPADLLVPTGTFSPTNAGEGSIIIDKDKMFDEIRFLGHNTAASIAAGDPSDYLVDGIELVLVGNLAKAVALGGDVATGTQGEDNFFYSAVNKDGVDTIFGFEKGKDQLFVNGGTFLPFITELGPDTLVAFGAGDGGIIIKGVTGLSLGTDVIFA